MQAQIDRTELFEAFSACRVTDELTQVTISGWLLGLDKAALKGAAFHLENDTSGLYYTMSQTCESVALDNRLKLFDFKQNLIDVMEYLYRKFEEEARAQFFMPEDSPQVALK